MGTNYYFRDQHIGKSSGGWYFSLHVIPKENINSLEDWKRVWKWSFRKIRDEYGNCISKKEMLKIITERKGNINWDVSPTGYSDWEEFHQINFSESGSNRLLRYRVDTNHCVGHGQGTWDLIIGTFS